MTRIEESLLMRLRVRMWLRPHFPGEVFSMLVYSLFDRKLKEYGMLVLSNNDEAIIRALKDGVPGSGSTVAKYPEDFDLVQLGVFDAETGLLVAEAVPRLVENVGVLLPTKEG